MAEDFNGDGLNRGSGGRFFAASRDQAGACKPDRRRRSFNYSAYTTDFLEALAVQLLTLASAGARVWCIFDSTAYGSAITNAVDLADKLAGSLVGTVCENILRLQDSRSQSGDG